jgi:hypothetical protein
MNERAPAKIVDSASNLIHVLRPALANSKDRIGPMAKNTLSTIFVLSIFDVDVDELGVFVFSKL